jgi:hypothetical protein
MQANALINHRRNKSVVLKRKEDIRTQRKLSRAMNSGGVHLNSKELRNSFPLLVAQIRKANLLVAKDVGIGTPGLVQEPACRLVRVCGSIAS